MTEKERLQQRAVTLREEIRVEMDAWAEKAFKHFKDCAAVQEYGSIVQFYGVVGIESEAHIRNTAACVNSDFTLAVIKSLVVQDGEEIGRKEVNNAT